MDRRIIIVARFFLCVSIAWGTEAWSGGKPEEKYPVEIVFTSIGVEKNNMLANGATRESPLQLKFGVSFQARAPLNFVNPYNSGIQYLDATDSTGRKLAPAEFRMGGMSLRNESGMAQAAVTGIAGELPSPQASWVRLKGTLRIPVCRSMKSHVYELPLEKEAEEHVLLPGTVEQGEAESGDIVLSEGIPTGRIFLRECSTFEKNGKKMRKMVLGLGVEIPFDLDHFEILNEKGDVLKTESRGGGSRMNSTYREWTKRLQFEEPEDLRKLRLRLDYKVPAEPVSIPVDVKLGMRGEIRDRKR